MSARTICEDGGGGFIFPLSEAERQWDGRLRAVLYIAALVYLFLGVNIASDKFMNAIEEITRKKHRVRNKGTGRLVTVKVWNETVANLSLMALGSSAPEILLSLVETLRNNFHSGNLGPATIIGSAAFNLFIIVAACIMSIPSPEVRRIKAMGVFLVTAAFSLFAYAWLVFILQVRTSGVVEIWEAGSTLAFFPLLILVSYLVDIGWWCRKRPPAPAPPGGSKAVVPVAAAAIADEGEPAANPAGVISFINDTLSIPVGPSEQREVLVPVVRKSGLSGEVTCKYRLEGSSAVPGYDFTEKEGELQFSPGVDRAEISLQLLPRCQWKSSGCLQVVLEDAGGGATFDPCGDGGTDSQTLTVTIVDSETTEKLGAITRVVRRWDRAVNIDSLRGGAVDWCGDVAGCIHPERDEDGSVSRASWAMHVISLPWKCACAVLVPSPKLAGGWLCFSFAILAIAAITSIIIDFAELLGCTTGIEDSITAITFVALGTSVPDFFASLSAAVQDESADASIVNVTGSNSVNVFLGIGLPWTISAVYWALNGPTSEWTARYGGTHGTGSSAVFVVPSGNLAFSVSVFTIAALVCLAVIRIRRVKLGGELGGPFEAKVLSSLLLVLLWVLCIGLMVWQVVTETTDVQAQAGAISLAFGLLGAAMITVCLIAGLLRWMGRCPAGRDLEQGSPDPCQRPERAHEPEVQENRQWTDLVDGRVAQQTPPTPEAAMVQCTISFASAVFVCLAVRRFKLKGKMPVPLQMPTQDEKRCLRPLST